MSLTRTPRIPPLAALLLALSLGAGTGCSTSTINTSLVPSVSKDDAPERETQLKRLLQREGATADRFAELANIQLTLGKLRSARTSVQRAIGLDAEHIGAMIIGARASIAAKDPERALKYYSKAVDVRPTLRDGIAREWSTTLVTVGRARAKSGSASGVLAIIDTLDARLPGRAATLSDERGELLLAAARLFLTQGDADRGGDALARARAAKADSGQLLFLGAARKLVDDDVAGARKDFEAWVMAKPSKARWKAVGDFCRTQRRYKLALEAYRKAADSGEVGLKQIANVALKAKKPDVAKEAWLKLAAVKKGKADAAKAAQVLLAGARELEDRAYLKRAHALYLAAVELAPQKWSVINAVGEFLSERYDHTVDVPKLVRRHLDAVAWKPAAMERAVKLLVASQQVIEASRLVKEAQKRPSPAPELWLYQAELMNLQANGIAREAALNEYVRRAGAGKLEVVTRAGRAWLRFKVLTKAEQLARQAYAQAPGNPSAALLMADVHNAQRRGMDETKVLDQLLKNAKDPARAALDVGRRYYERNDFQTAIRLLTQATRAKDKKVQREAHKLLFELYFQGPPASRAVAARHLRSWMQMLPVDARREPILRRLLDDTASNSSLLPVRQEVVGQLLELRPKDGALWASLGYVHLAGRRYGEARDAFDKALKYSERRADDAQRYGDRFAQAGQEQHALYFYDLLSPDELRGDPRSHLSLGDRYDRRGRRKRATRHFELYLRWLLKKPSSSMLRQFGDRMLRARRTKLAVRAYEAALKKNRRERDALLGLGRAFLRRGEVEAARLVMERYIAAEIGRSRKRNALRRVAQEFESSGALNDAARVLEELMAHERGRASSLFPQIAQLYRRMGDHERLAQAGRLYVELSKPRRAAALREVAQQLESAGLAQRAYGLLTRALNVKRRRKQDTIMLVEAAGNNALKRNDLAKAVEHFEQLALMRNSRPSEWRRIATMLANAGHPEQAAKVLDHPLRQVDADPGLFIDRGRYRLAAGQPDKAHEDFIQALTRSLSVSEMLTRIEAIYRENGQLERLRVILARAVQLMPARSQHFLSLGRLFLDAGRVAEASQAFQRYLSVKERGQIDVARAYARAGHPKRALSHYARSYEHARNASKALREAAELLVQLGLTDRLDHHVQRFLLASENPAAGFQRVAEVWEDVAGDAKKALAWRKRAWESKPGGDDHLRMGQLAWVAGKRSEAIAEFKKYVARYVTDNAGRPMASRIHIPVVNVLTHFLTRGEYSAALAMLDHVSDMVGSSPWLMTRRAQLLIAKGDVERALQLLAMDPRLLGQAGSAATGIIGALVQRDRLEEALTVVDKALATQRSDTLTRWRLKLRARLGLVEDAAATADELVRDGSPANRFEAGQLLFREGVLGPASKHLMAVIKETRGATKPNSRYGRQKTAPMRRVANATTLLLNAKSHQGKPLTAKERAEILAQAADTGEDVVASYTLQARVLYDAGDYRSALAALDQALALSPEDADLRTLMFQACIILGDAQGLFRRFEALPSVRNRASELESIASHASRMNQPTLALEAMERALKARSGSTKTRLRAVELAMRAGDEQAVERNAVAYTQALNNSKRAFLQLATLAAQHMYFRYAARWAKQAQGVAGLDLHVLNLVKLGTALHQGDKPAIEAAVDAVLAKAPDKRVARLQMGELLGDLSGPPKILLDVLKPLLASEKVAVKAIELAIPAAWRAGDKDLARKLLRKMTKNQPGRLAQYGAATRLLAGELLEAAVQARDLDGARMVMDLAAAGGRVAWVRRDGSGVVPGQAVMLTHLARACEAHYPSWDTAARKAFAGLLRKRLLNPDRVRGLPAEDLARSERALRLLEGNAEESFAVYDAVLARRPASTTMANNVAYELAQAGRELPRALKLVNRALALDQPFTSTGESRRNTDSLSMYLDTKAWILYKMGRHKEALEIQTRAVRLGRQEGVSYGSGALASLRKLFPLYRVTDSSQTEVLYHLGMIQRANKLNTSARNTFRDCARRAPGSTYAKKCRAALSETASAR